jgi:putative transcription factor
MNCEMCGKSGKLFRANIEGAELTVCENCAKFGKVIAPVRQDAAREPVKFPGFRGISREPEKETVQIIAKDYAEKIKKKRESLGLKQEEFAKKINEKESLVQNIESGHFEPSIDLAKKIEGFLRIVLIEDYEEGKEDFKAVKSDTFTIGDFIKIKSK